MKKIYIIPVAHVSKASINTVKNGINDASPDVVCVELCYNRFRSLMSQKRSIIPTLNPLHLLLYYVQQSIGWAVGIKPGEEMKTAIIEASKRKIKIALIDIPINIIMKGLSSVPLSEWFRAMFTREHIKVDISSMFKKGDVMYGLSPQEIEDLIIMFKRHLPTVYNVMIEKRNIYMVRNIEKVLETNDTLLCVIGAGHLPGILKLLKEKYKNGMSIYVLWPR
ncbi:TraB/GumN family protein [Candidatus Micrarchaeota archaeon]|nr:TraB/GumN family protein [Candidatus Micrarchaeota archaeon]